MSITTCNRAANKTYRLYKHVVNDNFVSGGIAQWQSIRLQIERLPVQLWLPPLFFHFFRRKNRLNIIITTTSATHISFLSGCLVCIRTYTHLLRTHQYTPMVNSQSYFTYMYICTRAHARIHTCIYTCMRASVYVYMYMYMHIHT